MSYLEPLTDEQAPEATKPIFASVQQAFGMVPNIFRTMGHSPAVLEACLQLTTAVQGDLPAKFRELAYYKSSLINDCKYCCHYHQQFCRDAGVTDEQLNAIDTFADSDLFDPQEKAVLSFAEQLTTSSAVDADTVDRLKAFLSDSQLVVLAGAVGLANFTNRFNHAFDIALP